MRQSQSIIKLNFKPYEHIEEDMCQTILNEIVKDEKNRIANRTSPYGCGDFAFNWKLTEELKNEGLEAWKGEKEEKRKRGKGII